MKSKKHNFQTIIVAGPTASGKTKLSLDLAQYIDAEIINADSMQVYRGLEILTSMPTEGELSLVKNHLFRIFQFNEHCSVGKWLELSTIALEKIKNKSKPAIIVGGSGMYLNAAINGLVSIPSVKDETRKLIKEVFENIGQKMFYEKLSKIDPLGAKKINSNDTQRLLRLYEVIHTTGKPIWQWQKYHQMPGILNESLKILIMPEKNILYSRINQRFEDMMNLGALDQLKKLMDLNNSIHKNAKNILGAKHLLDYINGKKSIEESIELAKRDTRRYAKRQLTWFRNTFNEDRVFSFIYKGQKNVISSILELLENKAEKIEKFN
mgnify:CR=1 FL=1